MPLQPQRRVIAVVITVPMVRLGQHQVFHGVMQSLLLSAPVQHRRDMIQPIQGFAQGKGQPGPDLENGETVLHQMAQRGLRLIVSGVRFEDQLPLALQHRTELAGPGRFIDHHVLVAELDARLHHQPHHSPERGLKTPRGKGMAVQLDGFTSILWGGHLQVLDPLQRTTRHRHFGANHIHR